MEDGSIHLFEKLASIELLVSDIYLRFSELFLEDRDFWWRLSVEERGHASLIKSGMETFGPMNLFPAELLAIPEDEVDKSIATKEAFLKSLYAPGLNIDRHQALKLAAEMEAGDIEGCFQNLMDTTKTKQSRVYKLFRLLNKDSAEHALRIQNYLEMFENSKKDTGSSKG